MPDTERGLSERLPAWEEQAERRLGIVEKKIDQILDPREGIYPQLSKVQSSLKSYAISILVAIIVGVAVQAILLTVYHQQLPHR